MKREIKFRAWDIDDKEMLYEPGTNCLEDDLNRQFTCDNDQYHWMQYTGLKDKNGKEIYEGDTLEHKPYGLIKQVVFHEASFMLEDSGIAVSLSVMWKENTEHLEISGNIHENPELK